MLALIGLVVGALAGRFAWGEWGAVAGGLIGFVAGALVSTQRQRAAYRKPGAGAIAGGGTDGSSSSAGGKDHGLAQDEPAAMERRMRELERRVLELEAMLGVALQAPAHPAAAPAPAGPAMQSGSGPVPPATQTGSGPVPPATHAGIAPVPLTAQAHAPEPLAAPEPPRAARRPEHRPNPVWAWFTGGNAMTRIGVVVLFFGVAFLLRWFAEHFTMPVEAKLLAVAAGGVALVVLGLRLARTRPAYGWSLQGAGTGVLYLTAFAAFREYMVIGAAAGFMLLAIIAVLTIWLALEADAQPLAGLALAGAFLAPMLTGVEHDPLVLFGYFALVNSVIVAIAWSRPWRAVYLVGAAFTFALALVWGHAYYRPEHYAVAQPFLALYLVMYVGIALLQARLAPLAPSAPVDGLLVFGVPLVAFALQSALVSDRTYGAAWSALATALAYAALTLALRRRSEPAMALLARVFSGLAVVFATMAVPFAFDNRSTAALWSIEAALVFWLGLQQRTPSIRVFAMVLQVAAGIAFVAAGFAGDNDALFVNAFFIGSMLVGLSALVTVWLADRYPHALTPSERPVLPLLFAWGALWWLGGGAVELARHLSRSRETHAVLAWVAGTAVAALALERWVRWPRIIGIAWALPAVMLFAAFRDIEVAHTTFMHSGWLLWPAVWAIVAWLLLVSERWARATDPQPAAVHAPPAWLDAAHTAGALGLFAHITWEASEWAGRVTAVDSVWSACAAALPAIVYLAAVPRLCERARWPFAQHRAAYHVRAATPIALVLAAWVAAVNVLSPGEPHPLPFVPLLNPLDITLAAALLALLRWTAEQRWLAERQRYGALGLGLFLSVNGAILRVGHHWGGIAWDVSDLLHSRALQAAFTLAWTITGVLLMYAASRRAVRALWMTGAVLLAVVVVKLFALDLATLSGLPRVVAFLGVGSLLLGVGWVSPLPPAGEGAGAATRSDPTSP